MNLLTFENSSGISLVHGKQDTSGLSVDRNTSVSIHRLSRKNRQTEERSPSCLSDCWVLWLTWAWRERVGFSTLLSCIWDRKCQRAWAYSPQRNQL